MTTIGAVGSSYAYPAGVKRYGDGSVIPTDDLKNADRVAWAHAIADSYNRSKGGQVHAKTAEDVLDQADESDRMKLQMAELRERFLRGECTYIGHSVGNRRFYDPELNARELQQMNASRSDHYRISGHHYSIEALNVDSALNAQSQLTGGDLKNLSYYAEYLRNEVAAASQAKADFTFTGRWGRDRVTHDVNEYTGWLMRAAQEKSRTASDSASGA